jgi:hypothetical protein
VEVTNYTFDWSQYRQMLLTFDWVKENKCPMVDIAQIPMGNDPIIEGICRSLGYRAPGVTPADQTEEDKKANPNHKQWLFRDRLGFNPVFAALEAKLDMVGRQPTSRTEFKHSLFAGGIVEVQVFGIAFHIVSAYMKFEALTPTNAAIAMQEQLAACGSLQFELYHKFANKAYYAKLMFTQPGCIPVRQTCMPNRRPLNVTDSNTFRREVTFFQKATPADFKVGPLPVMAQLIGEGVAVLHFSPPFFLFSELEGGTQLSTTVEPEGAVRLRASATVTFDIQDNSAAGGFSIGQLLDGASLGAEANLEVVRVSFPASAAFNFGTLMPCAQVGISTSALGGKVYLLATLLGARIRVKVFEWKGKEWENFPFEVPCCKFCEAACKDRSTCNFCQRPVRVHRRLGRRRLRHRVPARELRERRASACSAAARLAAAALRVRRGLVRLQLPARVPRRPHDAVQRPRHVQRRRRVRVRAVLLWPGVRQDVRARRRRPGDGVHRVRLLLLGRQQRALRVLSGPRRRALRQAVPEQPRPAPVHVLAARRVLRDGRPARRRACATSASTASRAS